MALHFEELWEKCEQLYKDSKSDGDVQSILDELLLKVNLYKAIDAKAEIPPEERQKMQSRTLGEILLTLTHLSLKDNVNVYEALSMALQYRSIEKYSQKYPVP
jgi:hypothetical protein